MLRRITILEPGDTTFMPGELVDRMAYLAQNRKVAAEGGQPASGRQMLMGITKASLATDSWLSAASFQETTKVLTEAAMNGKSDSLVGLKENVILGKLIPAGTGLSRYNRVTVEPTAEALAASNYTQMDFQDGGVSEDFLDALGAIDFGMSFRE
ncbi:DNA-directed RNA polymerase subunit beta' [Chlamydia trachomatis]|nr:DNA-directed RNA polymerase subunit beta' [Chlamydia trachomatis]